MLKLGLFVLASVVGLTVGKEAKPLSQWSSRSRSKTTAASKKLVPSNRNRHLQCLNNFDFRFVTELGCTSEGLEEFEVALQEELDERGCGTTATQELLATLGFASEEDVYEYLIGQCTDYWNNQVTQVNFREFMDDTDVWVKAFFDGGTHWNDLRQTNGKYKLHQDPGLLIEGHQLDAEHRIMSFPDEVNNPQVTNFHDCDTQAVTCCWVKDRQANDDNGNCETPYNKECRDADPADNVDVCYVEMSRAPESSRTAGGWAHFPGETEGDAHCHGFAWSSDELDPTNIFRGNVLYFVSLYDHLYQRGYVKNIPGAPMCACVEQQAVVDRADCTEPELLQNVVFTIDAIAGLQVSIEQFIVEFASCVGIDDQENDLGAFFRLLARDGALSDDLGETEAMLATFEQTVVGDDNCPQAIDASLAAMAAEL